MSLPFRFRFILSFVTIEIIFISLIVFFNFSSAEKLSHSLIDEKIETGSELFSQLVKTPMATFDLATLDNQAESFTGHKNVVAVQIYSPQNKILSYANSDSKLNINDFNETSHEITKGERIFIVRIVPIKVDDTLLGSAKILFEVTDVHKEIEKNKHVTFFLILLEISISLFIAYIVGYKLTKSLNKLTSYAASIAQEEAKQNIDISKGDEITVLSHTLHVMEERIEERNAELQLAASVFTHAREGIVITDANNNIVNVNQTFTRLTGYKAEEIIGRNPRFLKSNKQDPAFYAQMWNSLLANGYWYGEVWNRRKNGEEYAEMLTISTILDDEGKVKNFVALFSDITLAKRHEGELEHIAHYDALTNLPNRILLSDRLSLALVQSQRRNKLLAVVFIDLDGFKVVNDTHGHKIGDILLIKLAERMQNALREGDTLARLGGDEFVAILVDLETPKDCEPVLKRLLASVSEPVEIEKITLHVSASVGVSIAPQDANEGDQLIRQADQAMYQAKQSGKNRFHLFDAQKDSAIVALNENLLRIKKALDNHEFVLYYQPKVNLQTNEIIGAEALIRWIDPQRGIIPPLKFLPIVENDPMSIDIGEWVIDTALSQIAIWKEAGVTMAVSVNIGALQLQQKNFVTRLKELLNAHPEVESHLLELEILETSIVSDLAKVTKVIDQCIELGVFCALDDFGTGYSSLTHIRHLHVNMIKIDQTFVRDMLVDCDDLAIVEGVIGLAKAFKRDVIAEGVESRELGETLLELGCTLAQGYGIARPMPASEMLQWIQNWREKNSWK